MNINEELELIKERNRKVEADKAWETSKTRAALVALITYSFMVFVMHIIKVADPFVGAIIPTLGFLLSTLGIYNIKHFWIKNIYKKNM